MLLSAALYAGLKEMASALRSLGSSVEGFWSAQPQEGLPYEDLQQLIAEKHLAEAVPGLGLTADLVLESELE